MPCSCDFGVSQPDAEVNLPLGHARSESLFLVSVDRRQRGLRLTALRACRLLVAAIAIAALPVPAWSEEWTAQIGTPVGHKLACEVCHAPAIDPFATVRRAPWARAAFTDGTLPCIDAPPPWSSLVCLGCHEGVVTAECTRDEHAGILDRPQTRVCVRHRVGIPYSEALLTGAMVRRAPPRGLPLYGADQRVECATCHDVHGPAQPYLLRVSIAGSDLCMRCH